MPRDRQAAKGKNIRRAASSCPPQKEEDRQCRPITGLAVGGARNCAALPVSLLRLSVALARVPDLLVCAKHLFVVATRQCPSRGLKDEQWHLFNPPRR